MKAVRLAVTASATFALALVSNVHDSAACGGCFHPAPVSSGEETSVSVITDHRMAFKISTEETILWDQVRYSGDPKEFAWVLPVRVGAKVELSRDEWITALDATTKTTVDGPTVTCSGGKVSSVSKGSGGGGGGCGSSSTLSSYSDDSAGSSNGDTQFKGNEDVQVVSQDVIGPYQAVTIRSTDSKGVGGWLTANGFAIPPTVVPVIDAYTSEKFDFIALRLRPGQGTRAMRPVRIVSPGADTSLPLRMVAAGVGAHVGITLWIVSEGRYHTQNFPDVPIDWDKLAWDGKAKRSNMTELVGAALASNDQRGWITEAAIKDGDGSTASGGIFGSTASLYGAYEGTCITKLPHTVPCDETALPPEDGSPDEEPVDGGAGDGGDGGTTDAGTPTKPNTCVKVVSGCDGYDDVDVAMRGLHTGDVWVTRLRADLPATALNADLHLEAAPQVEDRPQRSTLKFTDASFNPCQPGQTASNTSSAAPSGDQSGGCTCRSTRLSNDVGSWVIIGFTAFGASIIARRRRHRR